MAPRCNTKLLFLSLFIYCWYTVTEGEIIVDCCLRTTDTKIPNHVVSAYRKQIRGEMCSIGATIFETRQDKHLCAPEDGLWVSALMKHVDNLRRRCRKTNYKGRRCSGVK